MSVIPPTEEDKYFRYQTIQGYVHDMAAAMQDGVGGHAGVFSNSIDLAKIMQMYLQKEIMAAYSFLVLPLLTLSILVIIARKEIEEH